MFNNRGYSTTQFILDGPFNDVSERCFDRLGDLFAPPLHGFDAPAEDSVEQALK